MRKVVILSIVALILAASATGVFMYQSHASDNHDHPQHSETEEAGKKEDHDHESDKPESHKEEDGTEEHDHEEGSHEEDHGDTTKISNESAKEMKIEVLSVGPAKVHQTISLTGKITLNQNLTAQVRARFPGVVKEVKKGIGDTVENGETIALIESNESLQVYPVKAPFAGTILSRNVNVGDIAEAEAIFVIADLNTLWAEFFVFSRDLDRIKPGQKIDIKSLSDNANIETVITSLLPTAESSSQTVVARAVIDSSTNIWRAGMTIRGNVVLSEREVPIAVRTTAVQRQEGSAVVYVQNGETYESRKVELGESDQEYTEILSGLKLDEKYVASNSFVVKADIGKAAAEHAH